MTAFPSMYYTESSSIGTADGRLLVRASNGALKVRQLYPSDKLAFDLEFELLSAAKSTLDGHYATDRDASFTYTDPATSTAYTVVYAGPIQYAPQPGGWWKARVRLEQV